MNTKKSADEQPSNSNSKQKEKIDKNKKTKAKTIKWVFTVLFLTLFLSFTFSIISELILNNAHIVIAYILVGIIVVINVLFDIIGTSAAACDIEPFLAMSSRKVRGSKKAVMLCKNAEKVSSICSDIIGDICGIISGACMATIVVKQFASVDSDGVLGLVLSVTFSAILAALTVTGKAIGKGYAVEQSNDVVYFVAKFLSIFDKK